MECIFTYLYAGEEVLKRVEYKTRSRKMFNLGSVGLDFVFAENFVKDLDLKIHPHDKKTEEFANFLVTHADKKMFDYAIGYVVHLYTAMEVHPALMEFSENSPDEYVRLSLAFDKMLAERVYNVSIEKVNLASKISLGDHLPDELDALLKTAMKEVYGKDNVDFNSAYKKFIYFLTLTYDPFLVKRMFYPFVKYISKFDIYKFTYPVFLRNIPENFYEKMNTSLQSGIRKSTEILLNLLGKYFKTE